MNWVLAREGAFFFAPAFVWGEEFKAVVEFEKFHLFHGDLISVEFLGALFHLL
jgi:hypothetical protein